jgi:hypothetical protein
VKLFEFTGGSFVDNWKTKFTPTSYFVALIGRRETTKMNLKGTKYALGDEGKKARWE